MKMKKRILIQRAIVFSIALSTSIFTVKLHGNTDMESSYLDTNEAIRAYDYSSIEDNSKIEVYGTKEEIEEPVAEENEVETKKSLYNEVVTEITLNSMDKLTIANDNAYILNRDGGEVEEGYLDNKAIITVEEESNITINGEVNLGQIKIIYGTLTLDGNGMLNIESDEDIGIYCTFGDLVVNNITLNVSGAEYGIHLLGDGNSAKINNVNLTANGRIAGASANLIVNSSIVKITGNYFGFLDGSISVQDDSKIEISGEYVGSSSMIDIYGDNAIVSSTGGRIGHFGTLRTNEKSQVTFTATGNATGTETDFSLYANLLTDTGTFPEHMPQSEDLEHAVGSGAYGLVLRDYYNVLSGIVRGSGATAGIVTNKEMWLDVSIINANIEGIGTGTGNYVYGVVLRNDIHKISIDIDTVLKGISHGEGEYNDFKSVGIFSHGGFNSVGIIEGYGGGIGIYSGKGIHMYEQTVKGTGTGENSAGIVSNQFVVNNYSQILTSKAYAKGKKYGLIANDISIVGVENDAILITEADNNAIRAGKVHHMQGENFDIGQIEVNDFGLIKAIAKDRNSGEASIMVGENGTIITGDGSKIIEQYKGPTAVFTDKEKIKPYASDYLNGKNMTDFMDYDWKMVADNGDNIDLDNNGTEIAGLIEYDENGINSTDYFKGTLMAIRTGIDNLWEPDALVSADGVGGTHIILMPAETVLPPVVPPVKPPTTGTDDDDYFIPEKVQEENNNQEAVNEEINEEVVLGENETPLGNIDFQNETGVNENETGSNITEEVDLEESKTPLGNGEFEEDSDVQKKNPATGYNKNNIIISSLIGAISIIIARFHIKFKNK